MKFIPSKYAVENEKDTTGAKFTCRFCNRTFVLPAEEASKLLFDRPDVCEDCKPEYEKEEALKAEADKTNAETKSEIDAALGN